MRRWLRVVAAVLGVATGIVLITTSCLGAGSLAAQVPRPSGYNFRAWANVEWRVNWTVESGQPSCSDWRKTVGYEDMAVTTGDTHQSSGIPGGFQRVSFDGTGKRTTTWGPGTITAVGRVPRRFTESERRATVIGGNADCTAFTPPPDDCDSPKTVRRFAAQLAIRAGHRSDLNSLADVVAEDEGAYRVIVVDGTPLTQLYRDCPVAPRTSEVPANVAFLISRKEVKALQDLKAGRSWFFDESRRLACLPPDELPEGTTCAARIDLQLHIRRIRRNERFP